MGAREEFKASLRAIGVDPDRSGYSLGASSIVYTVRYKNVFDQDIVFSVAHKNRLMLEDSLLKLPPNLVPRSSDPNESGLQEVVWEEGVQQSAHFSFEEWFELTTIEMVGTWYYLGQPDKYEEARETYLRLDPIGRILGLKPKVKAKAKR